MSARESRVLALIVLICLSLVSGVASGQEAPEGEGPSEETEAPDAPPAPTAEELYERAVAAFESRQWARAAEAFAEALEMDPNPVLAYNAGRANEYTGNLALAEKYYLQALQLDPDKDLRKILYDTLERLSNVRSKVEGEESKVGLLEVVTKPGKANILINGEYVGQSPYQSAYPAGKFTVNVELDGYTPFAQEVVLEPGKEVLVTAKLFEEGRLWTWITLGSAAALAGGGIAFGLIAQDRLDKANSAEHKRRSDFEDIKTEGENAATASVIFYGAAATAAVASVVIYFLEGQKDDGKAIQGAGEKPAAGATWHLLGGPGFVGVGGTF